MANQKQSDRFYVGGTASVAVPQIVGKAQEEFSVGDVSMTSGNIIVETLTVEESGFYNIYASTVFTNNPGGTGVDRAVQLNIHVNGVQQDGNGGYSQVNNTDTGIDYAGTSLAVQKALTAADVVTIRVSSNTSTGAIKNAWRRLAITPIQQSGNNLLVGTTASATTTEEGMVKLPIYMQATTITTTASTTTNSYKDLAGASLTLTDGTWQIGDGVSAIVNGTNPNNIACRDTSDTRVPGMIAYFDSTGGYSHDISRIGFVTVGSGGETYRLVFRTGNSGAGGITVYGTNVDTTGSLTNPDATASFWAIRLY